VLAYGYETDDTTGQSPTSGPSPQMLEQYPWMEMVGKVPTLASGPGWISLTDVVEGMPLLLALSLMPVYYGVSA